MVGYQGETTSILNMIWRPLTHSIAIVATLYMLATLFPHGIGPAQAQQQPAAANESQRIQTLEERIRDMQAVIGTLQSFVRDGGAAAAPGAAPAGPGGAPSELSIRVLALETQIRALTGQMKDVIARLDQSGENASGPATPWQQGGNEAVPPPAGAPITPPPSQSGSLFPSPQQPGPQLAPAPEPERQAAQTRAIPRPNTGDGDSRSIYDASYQSFVRNDLDGAETGFRNFIASHPDDPLTTNAYYWLGRTHFDRQQYEPAAKAFLAGYKRDKQGAIAPDSLLHLGLALARLGEKDAACSTLSAVPRQYPQSPGQLRQTAADAMKKAGC